MTNNQRRASKLAIRILSAATCALLWTAPPYLGQTAIAPNLDETPSSWSRLSDAQRENILALARDGLQRLGPAAGNALNAHYSGGFDDLVARLHDRFDAHLALAASNRAKPPPAAVSQALRHTVTEALVEDLGGAGALGAAATPEAVEEAWQALLLVATSLGLNPLFQKPVLDWFNLTLPASFTATTSANPNDCPPSRLWEVFLCDQPILQGLLPLVMLVYGAVGVLLLVVLLPVVVVLIVVGLVGQADKDADGLGDEWQKHWNEVSGTVLQAAQDTDGDGLSNLLEFRWELVPVCVNLPPPPEVPKVRINNCLDFEQDPETGAGGDHWGDLQEVRYWNDPSNDNLLSATGIAFFDPDRLDDADHDTIRNPWDPDSDQDGLLDGDEQYHRWSNNAWVAPWGTYPEFADSDCDPAATTCTPSDQTTNRFATRLGKPGTGDGLPDGAELGAWGDVSATAWATNHDADTIPNNLLDADADQDTLRDGDEFAARTLPHQVDSDLDLVRDGDETGWNVDTDRDGKVNALDRDSDADTMPDAWERANGFNMVDPTDATGDADLDEYPNCREFWNGEAGCARADDVVTRAGTTRPRHWDTDGDGLPDGWEARYAFDPLWADSMGNPDLDGLFTLEEYRWARPATWDEAQSGSHRGGTHPRNWDTDADAMPDGWEAQYALEPTNPNDAGLDTDADRLTHLQEYRVARPATWNEATQGPYWMGTLPNDPDTDDDELPDGDEVLAAGTNPRQKDTDGDQLPDAWEFRYKMMGSTLVADPLVADNATDRDQDSTTQAWCTNTGNAWTNQREYDHNKPAGFAGVWWGGTVPNSRDTDGDTLQDGYEVCSGSQPTSADAAQTDTDQDGLADGLEVGLGSNRLASDTDQDGLCDGGRAPACLRGGVPGAPGEYHQYHTNLLLSDTDADQWLDGAEAEYWDPRAAGSVPDTDQDGADNLHDSDSDGDGLVDGNERTAAEASDPGLADTDADGLGDALERSGWSITFQGVPLTVNSHPGVADTDQDGLSDAGEKTYQTKPRVADSDADGLCDGGRAAGCTRNGVANMPGESNYGTNPQVADTDNDQWLDGAEAAWWDAAGTGLAGDADGDGADNLHDNRSDADTLLDGVERLGAEPSDPGLADTDGDLLPDDVERNGWDYVFNGLGLRATSHPAVPDTDNDGLNDTAEFEQWTKPRTADSDGDGLCDGGRASACTFPGAGPTGFQPGEADYGSLAWVLDSDGDGLLDGVEARRWDAQATGSALDVDQDLLNGVIDPDSDNDRLLDGAEVTTYQSKPDAPDTDADGLIDGAEVYDYATSPTRADTDNDRLLDGQEVQVQFTKPTVADTDLDALGDGAEVLDHGTDPLIRDTDLDGLPDGWEVAKGTAARAADADQDPDADTLSNAREYALNTHPLRSDTDGDGMPDPFEDKHGLNPTANDANGDLDADGLNNKGEFDRTTRPDVADTDQDGLTDGSEVHTHATDPLKADTDADGLNDGAEKTRWNGISATAWNTNHDGDAFPNGLVDADSDNDGLDDGDEFTSTQTRPDKQDTDGDGLTDWQEVVQFGGRFNPNDPDTNHDGTNDFVEAFPQGDADEDGLSNADESAKGTNPTKPDTDCDGARDGPEANYWGGAWNAGYGATPFNRLLNADVDGDGLIDGLEIGTVSAPRGAVYRTNPAAWDTDGDGLGDNQEDANKVGLQCGSGAGMSTSSSGAWAAPQPGPSYGDVVAGLVAPTSLSSETLFVDPEGIHYVVNQSWGPFMLGAYGVALFPLPAASAPGVSPPGMMTASSSSTSVPTNPANPDTDRDGVRDGLELQYGTNPGRAGASESGNDQAACDTDNDGLGDGAEVGVAGWTSDVNNACTHRDADPARASGPLNPDTDGDGLRDGFEDKDRNGRSDRILDVQEGVVNGETDPVDGDTDDDGLCDGEESAAGSRTKALQADSDFDGLSDGLELGRVRPCQDPSGLINFTDPNTPLVVCENLPVRKAWQQAPGAPLYSTQPDLGDSDRDGLLDGLDDLNSNGQRDGAELAGTPDADGDEIADGLELRIWGKYSFCRAFKDLGRSEASMASKLMFNAANPLQTDPRNPNTDSGNDQVNDGFDVNPRGQATASIEFLSFQALEALDASCWGCESPYAPDVVFGILVDPPTSGFWSVETRELDFPAARDRINLATFLDGQTNVVKKELHANVLQPAAWVGHRVDFRLWDDIERYRSSGSRCGRPDTVCFALGMLDKDPPFNTDAGDYIDIYPKSGRRYTSPGNPLTLNLLSPRPGSCEDYFPSQPLWGTGSPDDKEDENGYLSIVLSTLIKSSFYERAKNHVPGVVSLPPATNPSNNGQPMMANPC